MSIITKRMALLAALLTPMLAASPGLADMEDDAIFTYFQAMVERRFHQGVDGWEWAARGWIGEDYNKLRFRSDGSIDDKGRLDNEGGYKGAEFQAAYSRLVGDFWDAKIGLRYSRFAHGRQRVFLAAGFEGLAPHWFDVDAMVFFSIKGVASARFDIDYEILLAQQLVLTPFIELDASVGSDRRIGQAGVSGKGELGLRVRYEIVREFAPYIGLSYRRLVGKAAGIARGQGEDAGEVSLISGLRVWF